MVVWDGIPARPPFRARRRTRGLIWFFALAKAGASSGGARDAQPARTAPQRDASYEDFVREHERAMLNYLWRLTGDEQSAYDLTQETFLRAWTRFEQVRGYDNPRGWLFRVATNLGISALARGRTLARALAAEAGPSPEMSDPARRLVERDQVRATLLRLNPQRRAALCLREVYGLSCAEVAKALGISEAAARMTLSRAREQFRELYLREEDEHDA
jgi:RNA polymerase sigma-70 factor (ECF subfamily)